MTLFRNVRRCGVSLATAAMLLVIGSSAQAAFYSSRFDPYGSGTFPGFSGEAHYFVDDACLQNGDGYFVTTLFPACSAQFLSATVSLFSPTYGGDLLDTSNAVDTLLFGPSSILGLLVVNGEVEAIDTPRIGPVNGHDPASPPDPNHPWGSSTQFWLQYQSGCIVSFPNLIGCLPVHVGGYVIGDPPDAYDPAPVVFLYEKNPGDRVATRSVPATDVTFARVPEPGTLALVAAALGLCWLGSRPPVRRVSRTRA